VGVLTQFWSGHTYLPQRPALSHFRTSSFRSQSNYGRVHVAAVCYRLREGEPEFLLVRTKNGHWTFPKGGVNEDETNAAAAAREAHEEAGVRGSIERVPFISYRHCKPKGLRSRREVILVHAHLCAVKRQLAPCEEYRDPTWFSASKARRRLQQYRDSEFAAEVVGVIDRATERIHSDCTRAR
jgi:8-oxo-dGTP pyrophosphatase MutT (NUDIX family)